MAYNFEKAKAAGLSEKDIRAFLKSKGREAEADSHFGEQKSFFSDLAGDIKETGKSIGQRFVGAAEKTAEGEVAQKAGEQTGFETFVQLIGNALGATSGAVGDIFTGAGKAVLPERAERAVEKGVEKVAGKVIEIPQVQQIIRTVGEKTERLSPRAKRNLEAGAGAGAFALDLLGAKAATKVGGEAIERGGKAIREAAPKVLSTAKKGAEAVVETGARAGGKVAKGAGDVVIGTPSRQAVEQAYKRPKEVYDFITGNASIKDVADKANRAISLVARESKKRFDDVVKQLPGNKVKPKIVIDRTTEAVRGALDNFEGRLTFGNLTRVLNVPDDEAKTVIRLLNKVKANKNLTDKGIMKLRQSIDDLPFFQPGQKTSNRVLGRVREVLNDIAGEGLEEGTLKTALKEASEDIKMIQQFGYNIRGNVAKNVEATSNKIKTLIKTIDDPTERQATKELLDLLKDRSGVDVEDLVRSLRAADILGQEFTGLGKSPLGTVQQLVTKGAGKIARGAGRITGQQEKAQVIRDAIARRAGLKKQ